MPYPFLADAVVVVHLGFVVFVAVGGFIAYRWPRVLVAHVPSIAWGLGIVTIGWTCPLTTLENDLRERAGADAYQGGFIDRYLTGVLYPTQYERLLQALVAVGIIAAYLRLVVGWRDRRRALADPSDEVRFGARRRLGPEPAGRHQAGRPAAGLRAR